MPITPKINQSMLNILDAKSINITFWIGAKTLLTFLDVLNASDLSKIGIENIMEFS